MANGQRHSQPWWKRYISTEVRGKVGYRSALKGADGKNPRWRQLPGLPQCLADQVRDVQSAEHLPARHYGQDALRHQGARLQPRPSAQSTSSSSPRREDQGVRKAATEAARCARGPASGPSRRDQGDVASKKTVSEFPEAASVYPIVYMSSAALARRVDRGLCRHLLQEGRQGDSGAERRAEDSVSEVQGQGRLALSEVSAGLSTR